MQESHEVRVSDPLRPRVMRLSSRGPRRSVDRGMRRQGHRAAKILWSPDADAVTLGGRQHDSHRSREGRVGLARSKTPSMRRTFQHGSREISEPAVAKQGAAVRDGKSKDASHR